MSSPSSDSPSSSQSRANDDEPRATAPDGRAPGHGRDTALARALFLLALCVYLLSSGREPPWGDASAQYRVAENLVTHGAIDIGRPWPPEMPAGRGGKYYSIYPIGASAVQIPGVVVLEAISAVGPKTARTFFKPLTSHLACSLLGALTVLLFFWLCRQRGLSRRASSLASLALAFATTTWVYAHYSYSEIAQAAWFTGLVLYLLRADDEPSKRNARWLGLFAGLLFATKYIYAASVLGGVVWLAWRLRKRGTRLAPLAIAAATTLVPFVIVSMIYNALCWGSPLSTRYQPVFGENLITGLWGMVLSPGKSVFLYSPPLLLGLAVLPRLWRAHRAMCTAFLAAALPAVAIYASYKLDGDYAWGPRYTVFAVPVAGFAFAVAIEAALRATSHARSKKLAVAIVCALGVAVQLLGNAFYWDHFIRISIDVRTAWLGTPNRRGATVPIGADGRCQACFEDVHQLEWLPPFQPILGQLWLARARLAGDSFEEAETYAPWRRHTSVSFARRIGDDYERVRLDWWGMLWISDVPGYRGLGIALLVLLLGATALSARWWLRAHRAAAEDVDP